MGKAKHSKTDEPARKPLVWLHGEVYPKKTRKIPNEVIQRCKQRLRQYDAAVKATKRK